MSGMANRAGKSFFDVFRMLFEAGIADHLVKVVAFAAECIGPSHAQVRIREKIGNRLTWCRSLAELIPAFQNVVELGAVRPVRSAAAEFTIVITVVTLKTLGRIHVLIQRNGMDRRRCPI